MEEQRTHLFKCGDIVKIKPKELCRKCSDSLEAMKTYSVFFVNGMEQYCEEEYEVLSVDRGGRYRLKEIDGGRIPYTWCDLWLEDDNGELKLRIEDIFI